MMNRRIFLSRSALASGGLLLYSGIDLSGSFPGTSELSSDILYQIFRDPSSGYRPFVRWWWNGNKVETAELIRELHILKDAGIGGVEINPVEFPIRSEGDDLGRSSVKWLSPEWIDLLKIVFDEARKLDMTCDLIVGSGWPFGSESIPPEERAQIVVIAVKKITGPADYEISKYELCREADPAVSSPFPGRTMELLSVSLVPDPMDNLEQVKDLTGQLKNETIKISIPSGKHAIYGLVRINGFMQVINGAPGATGPVLDHFNPDAVESFLNRMSDTIERQIGPLRNQVRALFTDSMELEGSNWFEGIAEEFIKRRGYDIYPYLPFILFKTGAMGNVTDTKYCVSYTPEFENILRRMRYDFELTKAELLDERFFRTFAGWCRRLGVRSRAQAYGRGFFPLESSFRVDIPESESWTMNWLKHRIGEEMPEEDYRRGRAYTMINKYVSSAANLSGKRLVSCEEMTDTYTVFNTTLEFLKAGGDQTAISGVSHSVFHGFNYSPPEAPYPGWIRYGGYYNEKNTWWPYFKLYTDYKARLSSVLQNVTMQADIAILPPVDDMWSLIGMQMEPFPSVTHIDWFTLVWEAINKNGNGCDYVSQQVIRDSEIKEGFIIYGKRKYHTIFLVGIDSLNQDTAVKLCDFIVSGGRIFCIGSVPSKSLGWNNHFENDQNVISSIAKMKSFPERFICLEKPDKDFIGWYGDVRKKYNIIPYFRIENPDPYVMANRYRSDDGTEFVYFIHSHLNDSYSGKIIFAPEIADGKYPWIWDPESGERFRIRLGSDNSFELNMAPAESVLFVFDRNKNGNYLKPLPQPGKDIQNLDNDWVTEFIHCREGSSACTSFGSLKNLTEIPEYSSFAGVVVYYNSFTVDKAGPKYIDLGKVYGLAELTVNGKKCGTKWYGRRVFDISEFVKTGVNELEIRVVTTMGNYMKSLTNNPIAQYWTNEKNKIQPLQPMGLIGPVEIY